MLTWRQESGRWCANGYVIELVEPFRWTVRLRSEPPETSAVSIPVAPLATARTLTEAKREAEILARRDRRMAFVQRSLVQLLLALSGFVFATALPVPLNVFLGVALVGIASRSLIGILGAYLGDWDPSVRDLFYQ